MCPPGFKVISLLLRSLGNWFGRVAVTSGLAVAGTFGGFDGMTVSRAATHASCSQCSPPTWHVVETANFRILSFGTGGASRQTAEACEALRGELTARWLGPGPASCWSPKCDLVLHSSDTGYQREVGHAGRNTAASALVERNRGQITLRRIDVRATRSDWQTGALAHELTHVVLADRFAAAPLPRWVDEGIAILADPAEKQRRHQNDFETALAARAEFRLHELVSLADYPAAGRWGTFYGQSASLVRYLVDAADERQFIAFVEASLDRGYDDALRQVYGLGVAELERRWRGHARRLAASGGKPSSSRATQLAEASLAVGQ